MVSLIWGWTRYFHKERMRPAACAGRNSNLGLGPLAVNDRLKLSGEIILRRYWRRDDFHVEQQGQTQFTRLYEHD